MKNYCLVIELKKEHVNDYCNIHRGPWPGILEALKEAGANELKIWNYKNYSIVFYECENLSDFRKKLRETEITKKWIAHMSPWFSKDQESSNSGIGKTCEKVFDLKQQLNGNLKPY